MNTSRLDSIDLNVMPEDVSTLEDIHTHSPGRIQIDLNSFSTDVNSTGNNMEAPEIESCRNKKKNFTSETKRAVFEKLLLESKDGKLPRGIVLEVAQSFSISRRSISRIWHDGKSFGTTSDNPPDFSCNLVKRVGRKRIELDLERVKNIPLRRRTNIRSLSKALDGAKSTVHRRIKEGYIRPHSNAVKPYLTEENKKARLEFCLSMIDNGSLASRPSFIDMYNQIHIDEKWFYMSKTSQRYYLHPDETEPYRTCKSKRFIGKVMFLAAVARPHFDPASNKEFDGKIGIWPFVHVEPAKRNSKNRSAGTLETKPILSVTKEVIRSCLLEKVLSAIREKWPRSTSTTVFIQQDNAKPHLDVNDFEFAEAVKRDGLDIRLYCQPPNSPDMNVLDLGFFRAIDSIQHQVAPATIDELILAVEKAYDTFPSEDLNNVFLTLQSCMIEVIKILGGNNYKIPHINKKKLIKNGQLPKSMECELEVLNEAKAFVYGGQ